MLRRYFFPLLVLAGLLFGAFTPALAEDDPPPEDTASADAGPAQVQVNYQIFMPVIQTWKCQATGESYGSLSLLPPKTDRPANMHGDLNLGMSGYEPTTAFMGLVNYGGGIDVDAPQLYSLFTDNRTATFTAAYKMHRWVWDGPAPDPGHRGDVIEDWAVTLLGMAVSSSELLRTPFSGYDIGSPYEVMVLYAAPNRIVLSYTRSDNIAHGYAIYAENICVDPNLLNLYESLNGQGRSNLPALRAGQAFGRALGVEVDIAVRDRGAFLDPRSRKDWWQGR